MAGVGFELKKVFRGGSVLAAVEGYSVTAVVTEGPMLLLMLVLLALYRLMNLYLRMDKLMKNHLLFLHDRRVPTNNNEAERQLRNYKRKQKQAVSFRSNQSHDYLCKGMSMLVMMRQNESNLFDRVSRILD